MKLSLFADNMVVSLENPKESTKKLPELSHFDKVEKYKIITQKPIAFLYTDNEPKLKNTMPFIIAAKMKYLGINLTKCAKSVCWKL